MVRKTALVICFLLSSAAYSKEETWDDYVGTPVVGAIWQGSNTTNDEYWIEADDVKRGGYLAGGFEVWIRGNHSGNKAVKYRRSLTKVRFTCEGTYYVNAYTSYNADDTIVNSWDGVGRSTSLRPGTVYAEIEKSLCVAK